MHQKNVILLIFVAQHDEMEALFYVARANHTNIKMPMGNISLPLPAMTSPPGGGAAALRPESPGPRRKRWPDGA